MGSKPQCQCSMSEETDLVQKDSGGTRSKLPCIKIQEHLRYKPGALAGSECILYSVSETMENT